MTEQELIEREELLEDILDALEEGDYEEVEDLSDDAIEQFPEEAFGYFYLGESLFFQTEYEEAIEYYQKAIELATDNSDYKARLALMYSKMHREEEAKQIYKTILDANPDHIGSLLALGVLEFNVNEPKAALVYLNQALELDADYVDGYRIRSLVHQQLNMFEPALEDLEHALLTYPTDSELLLQKIDLHDFLNQEKAACETFEAWIALDEESTERLSAYAEYLMQKADFAAAEKQYTLAIEKEIFGDLAALYSILNRGWARLRLDKLDEAMADFRKTIKLDAKISGAYMGMAEAKAKQGDLDSAVTFIDMGINVAVEDLWMLYDKKGEIYVIAKEWDLAKAAYQNNINMPDDRSKSEGYFGLGNLYQQQGDLQNAYLAWKEADTYMHIYAAQKIEEFCQEMIAAEAEANAATLVANMQDDFIANAQSKLLAPFLHKLWTVDVKATADSNPMFAEIPPAIEKQIMSLLNNICVGIEPEGIFVLNPGQSGVRLVYNIESEEASTIHIGGIPLNGSEKRTFSLTKKGDHLILGGFGEADADIPLYMQAVSIHDLPKATQKALAEAEQKGKLAFMGKAFLELL